MNKSLKEQWPEPVSGTFLARCPGCGSDTVIDRPIKPNRYVCGKCHAILAVHETREFYLIDELDDETLETVQ